MFFRHCIECLGFNTGPFMKNCSAACSSSISTNSMTVEMVEQFTMSGDPQLLKQCNQKDSEGCWVKFWLEQLVGEDNYKAQILKNRGENMTRVQCQYS